MTPRIAPLTCALAIAAAFTATAQEPQTGPVSEPPAIESAEITGDETAQAIVEADPSEETAFMRLVNSLDWTSGAEGRIGPHATIQVPEDYLFTGSEGTIKLMEAYGNLTNGQELGYLSPPDMSWFAVFEFDQVGYVKDDEKDSLDADEILSQLRAGQESANEVMKERGMSTLDVVGWHTPPFYNSETKNLEWAIRLRSSDGSEVLNYKTKILGRRGVMDVVVVCEEEQLAAVIPQYQKLLTGFAYHETESYAAFTDGDKIAEYGLTGLIVGGGLLAAAKTGLLAKFWKPIAGGLLVVGAFIKRIFTGKSRQPI